MTRGEDGPRFLDSLPVGNRRLRTLATAHHATNHRLPANLVARTQNETATLLSWNGGSHVASPVASGCTPIRRWEPRSPSPAPIASSSASTALSSRTTISHSRPTRATPSPSRPARPVSSRYGRRGRREPRDHLRSPGEHARFFIHLRERGRAEHARGPAPRNHTRDRTFERRYEPRRLGGGE